MGCLEWETPFKLGGAVSSSIFFPDGIGALFGNTAAAPDASIIPDGTNLVLAFDGIAAGNYALKINNAAPAAFAAAAGAGQSIYFRGQSAAVGSGLAGGGIDFLTGAGDGAGVSGKIRFLNPGGTSYASMSANGSWCAFDTNDAGFIFSISGSSKWLMDSSQLYGASANTRQVGVSSAELLAILAGEGAGSGLYLGLGQEHRLYSGGTYVALDTSQYFAVLQGGNAKMYVSSFGVGFPDATGIYANDSDSSYFTIKARDSGVGLLEVARVVGAAEPYLSLGSSQQHKWQHDGKVGVFSATPVAQQNHINDPAGGAVVDVESRTAIGSILDLLQAYGWMAA